MKEDFDKLEHGMDDIHLDNNNQDELVEKQKKGISSAKGKFCFSLMTMASHTLHKYIYSGAPS